MKRTNHFKIVVCCIVFGFAGYNALAQSRVVKLLAKNAKNDSIPSVLLPYDKVITSSAVTKKGLMTVHKVDAKWYLEIPDSIMGKDILIVNRISAASVSVQSGEGKTYAGDEINESVVRFEREENNIRVRKMSFSVYDIKPNDPMYANVQRSAVQPIILTLPSKSIAANGNHIVEITALVQQDNPIFAFDPSIKSSMKLGSFDSQNSYIKRIDAFPLNLSFKTVKTYSKGAAAGPANPLLGTPQAGNSTYEINSSWVLLPTEKMKVREYDSRVGYFRNSYTDFSTNPQASTIKTIISRWRIEPKPEDRKKYLAGELVEPVKPIVIYIDPTTPKKWVPYLIKGINDWQKAFERTGFKNAIIGREAPTVQQDSTWSIDDVRYSVLLYMPSDFPNAMGPHVGDPRTGEILETHINWYHDVMTVLHDWYMIQCGPLDPRARKAEFDDELMGELIRFVSSHEVGHTLGLAHNFIASNATPVEKLRDKAWLEKYGHTSSIMDYARFNYVAQPEDNIGPDGLFPRIGDYDKWAIEWGYKWFGSDSEDEENTKLRAMIRANTDNPRLQYSPGSEGGLNDPRAQREDLGDDAIKANTYGMKNLQFVAKNLTSWLVKKDGSNYSDLESGYNALIKQYGQYLMHSLSYIGGVYYENKNADQTSNNFATAPLEKQKAAMTFINRFLFTEPIWLYSHDLVDRLRTPEIDYSSLYMRLFVSELYNKTRLGRLINLALRYGNSAYQPASYLMDLQNMIWSELSSGAKLTRYRMQLQNVQLEKMVGIISQASPGSSLEKGSGGLDLSKTEVGAMVRELLNDLDVKIDRFLKSGKAKDVLLRAHLKSAQATIRKSLAIKS